jgi:hypothetical protein
MTVGQRVIVYQKPITQEGFEGTATVVRVISKRREDEGTLYRLMVNFPEDGPEQAVERMVMEFLPAECSICRRRHGPEVIHACE